MSKLSNEMHLIETMAKNNHIVRSTLTICLSTGSKIEAVPMFDTTSVTMAVMMDTTRTIKPLGRVASPFNCSPNHLERPDLPEASPIANPPPTKKIIPHGILFWITSHVMQPSVDLSGVGSAETI